MAGLAKVNPPPGTNAANGLFRDMVVSNKYKILGNPIANPNSLSGDAQRVYKSFIAFSNNHWEAFDANKNVPCKQPATIVGWALKGNVDAAIKVSTDIITLVAAPEITAPMIASSGNDIRKLCNGINNNGLKKTGINMNGHIARAIKEAANKSQIILNSNFDNNENTKANKIDKVLRKCFTELSMLKTDPMVCWLTAEWQVNYFAIMNATALELSKI